MSSPIARAAFDAARRGRLIRGALGILVAAAAVWASPLASSPAAASEAPLPACRYDDVLTTPRTYADSATTLVDTILRVGQAYVPPDLVKTSEAGIAGGGLIRSITIDDLRALTDAALANGTPIAVESSYRSYATQISTFQYWVNTTSYAVALRTSARPGHSEHQLGVAIDFKSASGGPPWSGSDWATSPAGAWMKAHAWEYGWLMSYPKGKSKLVCYDYEPWHYRYVGRDLAAVIHATGLTTREYLWRHFTTAVVPPAPIATPTPRPKSPKPSASALASSRPTPTSFASASAPSEGATPAAGSAARPPSIAVASPPPATPVGSVGGDDTTVLAAGGLAIVAVGLVGSLLVARRRTSGSQG